MGTLRLTLLRHGQAEPVDSCREDFERTLTRRGLLEAREMGARLVLRELVPDLILVSPAERTWATATAVAGACELDAKQVQCARELYLASAESMWRLLRRNWHVGHLLICGHNPGLSRIASRLGPTPQTRELPTAGLATAVWQHADWMSIEPETASLSEFDDPMGLDQD